MTKYVCCATVLLVAACAQKIARSTSGNTGNTRTRPVEYIDDNTYLLQEASDDPTYAFRKSNPVKVGGSNENSGPANERRYLNALLGPNGEEVRYVRAGSCCPFNTPTDFLIPAFWIVTVFSGRDQKTRLISTSTCTTKET